MGYSVEYTRRAIKQLSKLPAKVIETIEEAINELARDPFAEHLNVTRLQGRSGYRLRQGDWRIIYELDNNQLRVLVLQIGNRKDVYK